MVEVYYERLCRFSRERLLEAINTTIDRSRFFPTIAELIENIPPPTKVRRLPPPSEEEAKSILTQLRGMIEKYGTMDDEKAKDRIAKRKKLLKEQAKALKNEEEI